MPPTAYPADRRRAADQLGVPADAAPADARAAFLHRLPDTGFVPPPPLCAAAATLTGRPTPGASGTLVELPAEDDALRAEVGDFARVFWASNPVTRRARWQGLLDRAADDPPLAARLRRLEAGVDLPDATRGAGPPRQREIVGMIQALFVLSPADRAARRREWLDRLPPPAAAWERAAQRLPLDLPAHAALEPALVERLSAWTRRVAAAAAAAGRPAATWEAQVRQAVSIPRVRRAPASSGRRVPVWWSIFAVMFFLRVITTIGSNSSNPPAWQKPQPQWTVPYPSPRTVPSTPAPYFGTDDFLRRLEERQRSRPSGVDSGSPDPTAPDQVRP